MKLILEGHETLRNSSSQKFLNLNLMTSLDSTPGYAEDNKITYTMGKQLANKPLENSIGNMRQFLQYIIYKEKQENDEV